MSISVNKLKAEEQEQRHSPYLRSCNCDLSKYVLADKDLLRRVFWLDYLSYKNNLISINRTILFGVNKRYSLMSTKTSHDKNVWRKYSIILWQNTKITKFINLAFPPAVRYTLLISKDIYIASLIKLVLNVVRLVTFKKSK